MDCYFNAASKKIIMQHIRQCRQRRDQNSHPLLVLAFCIAVLSLNYLRLTKAKVLCHECSTLWPSGVGCHNHPSIVPYLWRLLGVSISLCDTKGGKCYVGFRVVFSWLTTLSGKMSLKTWQMWSNTFLFLLQSWFLECSPIIIACLAWEILYVLLCSIKFIFLMSSPHFLDFLCCQLVLILFFRSCRAYTCAFFFVLT